MYYTYNNSVMHYNIHYVIIKQELTYIEMSQDTEPYELSPHKHYVVQYMQ